jgi:hypothetical protein
MQTENGKRSLYPGWTMTTALLSGLGVVFAAYQLLSPHALTADRLQQLGGFYLITGFVTFSLTTIIDNMIDLNRDIREAKRAQAEFDAHMEAHRKAHGDALHESGHDTTPPQ